MINRVLKITAAILLLFGLSAIGMTNAYFTDTESSTGNIFSAGSLMFSLRNPSDVTLVSPLFNIANMMPGNSDTKSVTIKKEGSLDFPYKIWVEKTGGDDALFNALQIEALLDGVSQYNAGLSGISLNPAATITGASDDWTFTIRLDSSETALENKSCSFNLRFNGWQIGSDGSWGFTHEKLLTNTVITGTWITTLSSPFGLHLYSEESTSPSVSLSLSDDKKSASFTISDIKNFETLSYELTYDTDPSTGSGLDSMPQGIKGDTTINGKSEYSQLDIPLGTSSTGVFVYHKGVKNLKLTVTLTDKNGKETVLEQTL